MTTSLLTNDWVGDLGLTERQAPGFYRDLEQIQQQAPTSQAHAMRRAWQDLRLDGIFCIDDKPTVYFKEMAEPNPDEIRSLQRRLWNQGVAPLLVLITPAEIQIYSGLALPASDDQEVRGQNRLAATLDRVSQALEIRQFTRSIESGEFFRERAPSFDPDLRVDRYLLRNIDEARLLLSDPERQGLDPKTVHALLGRMVFTCYLVDRQIIGPSYFSSLGMDGVSNLRDLLQAVGLYDARDALYRLFHQLHADFNGDLFDGDLGVESQGVQDNHLNVLRRFLRGDDLGTGQASLGFWAYDFHMIPIETISAIYESFLTAADPGAKRAKGAYYTPRFLAEIVLDTALEDWPSVLNKRFLDPACGSGIFLVGLFNRMAEEWRRQNPFAPSDERFRSLKELLQDNLVGIDSNETACRITAFSLYLALLDQLEPRDIQQLQAGGRVLPKLVLGRDHAPDPNARCSILCRDFGDADLPLESVPFDLVVGNPPWARATGSRLIEWCNSRGRPVAQKQLAQAYVWKSVEHTASDGRICFLLPAATLLNQQPKARQFQHEWLSSCQVERVINLADMSLFLFEKSQRPALIARFTTARPDVRTASIAYDVPKTDFAALRADILQIMPTDRVAVRLRSVLAELRVAESPLTWKEALWGTPRDRKFLTRLDLLPKLSDLAGPARGQKRLVISQGFQPFGDNDEAAKGKPRPWPDDTLFLPAKKIGAGLVVLQQDANRIGAGHRLLRRLPSVGFSAPQVLVTQGLHVAYADFDAVFQHSVQGIRNPRSGDRDALKFLAAVLDSDLARYYLFHTAANWGTERDKVLEQELLRMPFWLPDQSSATHSASSSIVHEVVRLMDQLGRAVDKSIADRSSLTIQARAAIEPQIYEYYDIGYHPT